MGRLNAEIECQESLLLLSQKVRDDASIKALTNVTLYVMDLERHNMELQLAKDMKKSKAYSQIIKILKQCLTS